jgi:hypothetical protein
VKDYLRQTHALRLLSTQCTETKTYNFGKRKRVNCGNIITGNSAE